MLSKYRLDIVSTKILIEGCAVMEKILARYAPQTYAVMRIIVGLLFFCHGLQKVFGWFGGVNGAAAPVFSLLGIAGLIELVTGTLIAAGIATAKAAFIASGLMAAAYFMTHFPAGLWPIQNDGELSVLYCFLFLYMAMCGSGIWSGGGGACGALRSLLKTFLSSITLDLPPKSV
jgi:putative oxidoreductase